jgi:hypothetical protein
MAGQQKTIYRSMQGKEVDMNKLMNQNELTVAVGNVKVNARGDELGPGGKIIRKIDETVTTSVVIPDETISHKAPVNVVIKDEPVKQVKQSIKHVTNMDIEGKE